MRAGQLRHQVVLEKKRQPVDRSLSGAPVDEWIPEATLWANVTAAGGSEGLRGVRESAMAGTIVEIRYREGVTPDKRFRFGTRILDIEEAADPDGRGRSLLVRCQEVRR